MSLEKRRREAIFLCCSRKNKIPLTFTVIGWKQKSQRLISHWLRAYKWTDPLWKTALVILRDVCLLSPSTLLPAHSITFIYTIHHYRWSHNMVTHSTRPASTWEHRVWEMEKATSRVIINSFKASPVTINTATCICFAAVPKETCFAARTVSRKDKFTDDHELWPHAISRHLSGDSTILRLRKAWPEVTATSCRSCQCSLSQCALDRIERTPRTKNTNAGKLQYRSQNEHGLRKWIVPFVCQGEVLEEENTSYNITTHCDTCTPAVDTQCACM